MPTLLEHDYSSTYILKTNDKRSLDDEKLQALFQTG